MRKPSIRNMIRHLTMSWRNARDNVKVTLDATDNSVY